MKKLFVILTLTLIFYSVFCYASTDYFQFEIPDQIIIYKNGSQQIIDKKDSLFDKFVTSIKQINYTRKVKDNLIIIDENVNNLVETELKGNEITIEFKYNESFSTKFKSYYIQKQKSDGMIIGSRNIKWHEVNYNKIIFPRKKNGFFSEVFFVNNDKYYKYMFVMHVLSDFNDIVN